MDQLLQQKYCKKPDGVCNSFLAYTPLKPASSTVFDPRQVNDADATEPHIRPKVYIRNALPEETSGIGTAHAEQTIAWPKPGDASSLIEVTWSLSPCVGARCDPLT